MELLQRAAQAYDSYFSHAVQSGTAMMAPVGHIVARAELEITLDRCGSFVDAAPVDRAEPRIVIPATEQSAGRTSAPCPHPLCDQLSYLIPDNPDRYRLYVEQLSAWAESEHSHPKLLPVLRYVRRGTVLSDLRQCGLTGAGRQKQLVRWRILGEPEEACWLDRTLFDAFSRYDAACRQESAQLCTVSGRQTPAAKHHPKGIIPIHGNAKLISANDSVGFTYRGRFFREWQAASIGYETSQKAHNALRWLAQEQGVIFGGRTFLCFNPQGHRTVMPAHPLLWQQDPVFLPGQYRQALDAAVNRQMALLEEKDSVVIAALDAATTGRLSLTYYNELSARDYLQRLRHWDMTCCWTHRVFGIRSPSLRQIVDCAFGTQRWDRGSTGPETEDSILRRQMQRLTVCRVEGIPIGTDIVRSLVSRATRSPVHDEALRERFLFTACAVVRKYRYDTFREEWSMTLEPQRADRSYQFGRLLAVLESARREANSIQLLPALCQSPMSTVTRLLSQPENRCSPTDGLTGQILEIIRAFPSQQWDAPLDDSYLLGYYLQRSELRADRDSLEENHRE